MTTFTARVKNEFLPAFIALAEGTKSKFRTSQKKAKKLSKFERLILKEEAELEKARKKGTLRGFDSVDEMIKAIENE